MKRQRGAFGGGKARHGEKPRVARPTQLARRFRRSELLIAAALAVATLAVYGQVISHQFINFDDDVYITLNAHVLHGVNWQDVKWAFTTAHGGYAHPVTWLTHQFDYQLHGAWAGGHHLTNVVLHTINALLLFLLFWRMTRELWPSAFVAALFAIHPLHVESVAWVAERKDVLSGLFFLLTLHAYAAYAAKPKVWRYVLALGLFILGILSKPMLVTVPFVLLLLDYWPLRRMTFQRSKRDLPGRPNIGRLIWEKVPFALVAGAWSIVTFVLQKGAGAIDQHGILLRIANAIVSYATYLWNTFWPQNLAVFYPYPVAVSWGLITVSAALLVLISFLCIARRRSSPYLIVGWFWYLGMLVPVIGLIQVGAQAHADRYTYLPQIGLCFALSWEVAELTKSWSFRRSWLPIGAAVVIAMLMVRTWNQTAVWHDSESLWRHALAVTANNAVVHNNLGSALGQQGKHTEAIPHFAEAVRIRFDYFDALLNLGMALREQGRAEEAVGFFRRALREKPDSAKAHWQLGLALDDQGENNDAMQQFYEAIKLTPEDYGMRTDLGVKLAYQGKLSEAIEQCSESVRLNPNGAEAHYNLGLVLFAAGKQEESVREFSNALRLKPDLTVARDSLKRAQAQVNAQEK